MKKPCRLSLMGRMLIFVILTGFLVLGISGDWYWQMGWTYLAVYLVIMFVTVDVFNSDTDLVKERKTAFSKAKKWDKIIMPMISIVLPMLTLVIAALDHREGWSGHWPFVLQLGFTIPMFFGILFASWAMKKNSFFSSVVRIQSDRGHRVISDGPYAFVRHPGYAGSIIYNVAVPLVLGSFMALIPTALAVVLFIVRTFLEDAMLKKELDGYAEYAQKVKFRLFPLVW